MAGNVGQSDLRFDASNSYYHEYSAGANWLKPVTGWPYPDYLFGTNNNYFGLIKYFVLPQGATYKTVVSVDFTPLALVNN